MKIDCMFKLLPIQANQINYFPLNSSAVGLRTMDINKFGFKYYYNKLPY